MQKSGNRYRWVTKSELWNRCLAGNVFYVINGQPSEDVGLVKKILSNKGCPYRYSVSIDAPDAAGRQRVTINYEVVDRSNR